MPTVAEMDFSPCLCLNHNHNKTFICSVVAVCQALYQVF